MIVVTHKWHFMFIPNITKRGEDIIVIKLQITFLIDIEIFFTKLNYYLIFLYNVKNRFYFVI